MAKSDFEIQTESEQLWPDLVEWRDAAVAVVTAERDAAISKCEAIITKLQDPDASKEDAAAEAAKEAKARELESLEKQKANIQLKIDALNGGK